VGEGHRPDWEVGPSSTAGLAFDSLIPTTRKPMKKLVIFLLTALAAGVLLFLSARPQPQNQQSPPVSKLSALESEIEQSLRNANPTADELQREIELHSEALFFANELVLPDGDKTGSVSAADSLAANQAPAAERDYDLPALEARFLETMQQTDEDERRSGLRDMASFLAGHDPATASRLMKAILDTRDRFTDGDGYAFATVFIDEYAQVDPAAAAQWCEMLPEQLVYPAHQMLTRHWVAQDPRALDTWMQTLNDDGLRANVIRMMSQSLSVTDSGKFASQWSADLAGRSKDGPRLSEVVVSHWGKVDFDSASAWASDLTDPDDREGGLVGLAKVRAESDAAAAAAWARDSLEGSIRAKALQETLIRWTTSDPSAAAAWIDQLGEPAIADATFDTVALAWLKKDEAKATQWIATSPIDQRRKDYLFAVIRQ
jgi:hypothetical protein